MPRRKKFCEVCWNVLERTDTIHDHKICASCRRVMAQTKERLKMKNQMSDFNMSTTGSKKVDKVVKAC